MIFFSNPKNNFTMLDNKIAQDDSLSLQARGLYWIIRSFGINWKINRKHLAKKACISINTLGKYLNELFQAGLLQTIQIRDDKGRFTNEIEYIFNDIDEIQEINLDTEQLEYNQLESIHKDLETKINENELVENENIQQTKSGYLNFGEHINIYSINKTEIDSAKVAKGNNKTKQYAVIDLLKLHKQCYEAIKKTKDKFLKQKTKDKNSLDAFLNALTEQEANKYHEFIAYRTEANNGRALKQTTKKAIQRNILRLKQQGQNILEVIQRSIDQGWLGLFAIEAKKQYVKTNKTTNTNTAKRAKQLSTLKDRYGDIYSEWEKVMKL